MPFLLSTVKGFVGASVGMLAVVLTTSLFAPGSLHLWLWSGMAVGIALAAGIRAQWKVSGTTGAVVVGASVAICSVLAQWLSMVA